MPASPPPSAEPGEPGGAKKGSSTADADAALLLGVARGETSALESLYDHYGRPAYSVARRIVRDEQLAQDVVQEVFLTLWRDAARFDRGKGTVSTWLLSMTHHKAVDAVRREETVRRRGTEANVLRLQEAKPVEVEEEVWTVLRAERVREAIDTLPSAQREALTLAYFRGYTQREIAERLDTPLGTVKTRMLAGMRKLRTLLAERLDESGSGS